MVPWVNPPVLVVVFAAVIVPLLVYTTAPPVIASAVVAFKVPLLVYEPENVILGIEVVVDPLNVFAAPLKV